MHPHQCKKHVGPMSGSRSVHTVARAAIVKPFRARTHVQCCENLALLNPESLHRASNQLSRRALLSAAVILTASGPANTLAGETPLVWPHRSLLLHQQLSHIDKGAGSDALTAVSCRAYTARCFDGVLEPSARL